MMEGDHLERSCPPAERNRQIFLYLREHVCLVMLVGWLVSKKLDDVIPNSHARQFHVIPWNSYFNRLNKMRFMTMLTRLL